MNKEHPKNQFPEKNLKKIDKIEEVFEKSEKIEKSEKKNKEFQENYEKMGGFDKKPPLSKNSSLRNLKEMDNALKSNKEIERIDNIMKGNGEKSRKFYDFSSDSD